MDSALKAYSQSWRDPKGVYNERHLFISQRLPQMPGYQLQNCINDLNEDLEGLKVEIQEIEAAISQLREDKDPEAARHKFRVSYPLSSRSRDVIQVFKNEIEWRQRVSKWIRREKQVYVWEFQKRRLAAAKLPFIRRQRTGLNKEAHRLLCQIKSLAEQLTQACQAYRKVCTEYYGLGQKIELSSLNRETFEEGKIWTGVPVPSEIKELKCLEALELEEKEKGEGKGLRKLFKHRKEAADINLEEEE